MFLPLRHRITTLVVGIITSGDSVCVEDDGWEQVGLKLYCGLPQMCLTEIEAFNDVHYNTNLGTTGCAGATSQGGSFVENYCVGEFTGWGENDWSGVRGTTT